MERILYEVESKNTGTVPLGSKTLKGKSKTTQLLTETMVIELCNTPNVTVTRVPETQAQAAKKAAADAKFEKARATVAELALKVANARSEKALKVAKALKATLTAQETAELAEEARGDPVTLAGRVTLVDAKKSKKPSPQAKESK